MIVVVPSTRTVSLEYLKPLIDSGARFIVVDDSEGSIKLEHPQFAVYTWKDQDRLLGDHVRAIPRRNGACRDFGFYIAWKESDAHEAIIALDDDCQLEYDDFAQQVEEILSPSPRPVGTGVGRHFNVLDCYCNATKNIYPRGFPYSARAEYTPWRFDGQSRGEVTFNLGLWQEIFDVNAIDKLRGPQYNYPDAKLTVPSVVVPDGALISACSMNMHFRREVIPAVYQLLMHVEVMPGWVIDRYGDIWGGFILKTLMDIKGEKMAVGAPTIRHLKEGSYERNIWQEHICHLVNDEFLAILERSREFIQPTDYVGMMAQLTECFQRDYETSSTILKRYFDHQIPALKSWVKILS
jgi:hypothetical protein